MEIARKNVPKMQWLALLAMETAVPRVIVLQASFAIQMGFAQIFVPRLRMMVFLETGMVVDRATALQDNIVIAIAHALTNVQNQC